MKKALSAFILLFILQFSGSGQKWFPVGATWNYNWQSPLISITMIKVWVQKDTVVNGIPCKQLNQAKYYSHSPYTVIDTTYYTGMLYAYERNDSVYFLQNKSFVLVYNLNMQVGDTSGLTAFYIDTAVLPVGCIGRPGEAHPVFKVKSIDTITVGGQFLKVFNDTINEPTSPNPFVDIQRIGNNHFIIPQITCGIAVTGQLHLSCYTDTVIGTYLFPSGGACDPFNSGQLQIQFYGNYTVCPGTSITLNAHVSGGVPPYKYQWSANGGGALSCDTCASPVLTINNNTTVTVTATDAANNEIEDVSHYTIGLSGQINVIANGHSSLCQGGTDTLGVTGNYSSYIWSTGDTTATIVVSQTGNYIVTVSSGINCTGTGNISVTIATPPAPQNIVGNASVVAYQTYIYAVNLVSGITYTWTVLGGAIESGQGTNTVNVLWANGSSGTLTLVQTNSQGCSDTTTLQVINTGISTISNENINIYFYVSNGDNIIKTVNAEVYDLTLFDISGRVVFKRKSISAENILPHTLSSGAYIAEAVFPSGTVKNLKIIIR